MSAAKSPTDPGYRGALPPRNDWLARGWVVVVIALFILMFVLDILNVPTRLIPEPTPVPIPTPVESVAPSGSGSAAPSPSGSAEPSGSGELSGSAAPSGSASPTP